MAATIEKELEETKAKWQQTQQELDKTKSELHDVREELERSQSQLDEVLGELEQTHFELHQLKEKGEQQQSESNGEVEQELEETKSKLQETEQLLEESQSQLSETMGVLEEYQSQMEKTMGTLEESQGKLQQKQEELEQVKAELAQKQSGSDVELQKELEETKSQLRESEQLLEQYQSQLEETMGVLEESQSQLSKLREKEQQQQSVPEPEVQKELEETKAKLQETEELLEEYQSQLEETMEVLEQYQSQLQQAQLQQKQYQQLSGSNSELHKELEETKTKLQETQIQRVDQADQKANVLKNQLENNQFNTYSNLRETYETQIQEIYQANSSLKTEIEQLRWTLSQIVNTSLSQLSVYFDISSKQNRVSSNKMLVEFFIDTAKLLKPDYFFDIGSRDGSASVAVKKAVPTVKCWAFEANINNFETFKDRDEFKQLSIDYRYLAVTNYNGVADFHIPTEVDGKKMHKNIGNASLMTKKDRDCQYKTTRVDCTKLDDFCRKNNIKLDEDQNLALWIDVEGAALQVIEGAKNCLAQTSLIILEVEEIQYWNSSALADKIINKLILNNFIPVTRDFERLMQYNLLFINSKYLNQCKGLIYKFFSKLKN